MCRERELRERFVVEVPVTVVEVDSVIIDFASNPKLIVNTLRAFLSIELKFEGLNHFPSPPTLQLYTT